MNHPHKNENDQAIKRQTRLLNAVTASKLGAMRMTLDISVPELAKRSGVPIETIETIEKGIVTPDLETLTRLALAMERNVFIEFIER